ncbi:histidine phosphatase family protein [Bradyrhizobium sp. 192]|uniref:histidine phosphatase family protein n=1 Tax=Bradyrhizobium sp. 192 TaxID=2782660 RepID=UPI0020003C29|nr:histidine phosphatase family protein [Bradyrhizobium sp. 192]UPJ61863.1 histidine phosphatase family protein [Bradyrhizobium sp. 192]
MARVIHLVRHGHHALLGRTLCGRMKGVALDELGCEEIAHCADAIDPRPNLVQSSPQRRCLQSACILATHYSLAVEIVPAVDELDYGDWTGQRFDDLDRDPRWSAWNTQRGTSRPPGGESMRALQQRVIGHLEQLRSDSSCDTVVVVSHAEPIRTALLHYQGLELDDFLSVEIEPGSVSTLTVDQNEFKITGMNQRARA